MKDLINKLEEYAKFKLKPEEYQRFEKDLASFIEMTKSFDVMDLENVRHTNRPFNIISNELRSDDEVSNNNKEIEKISKFFKDGLFVLKGK